MTAHWTRQIAKSLESGRPSRAIETHLDALLLWLANPDNPRAGDLDRAIGATRLDRGRAATRAYQLLDQALFPTDRHPSAATLGLPQDADQDLAKQRYRRLIQVYHPDRHPDKTAWATLHTEQLNRAFDAFRRAEASNKGATTSSTPSRETPPGPSTPGERITHAIAWIQSWTRPQPWRELIARPKARRWAGAILATALILALAPLFHEKPKPQPKIIHHPLGEVRKTPPKETVAPEPQPLAQAEPEEQDSRPAPEETDAIPPVQPESTRTSETPTKPETPTQIALATPETPPTLEPAPDARIEPSQEAPESPGETSEPDASSNQMKEAPAASPSPSPTETDQETAPVEPPPESTETPKASEPASPPTEPNGIEPETTLAPLVPPMTSIGQEPPNLAPIIEQPPIQPGFAPEPAAPLQPELQIPSTPAPTPPTPPQSPRLPMRLGAAPATIPGTRSATPTANVCSQVPALMQAFQHNYQSGSLDDFMALYSPLAKENDLGTWFAIRQTYRQWFATTRARRIDFDQLRVKPTADGKRCAAIATFEVIFLDSDSKLERRNGTIQILFEQSGTDLLILRVRY
ncbi:DnaJ domain-containing protein [Thiorhodococcus fuscus]|uniref:DnaJ domain-containing protein n=1 Tax=Thiorhodococcus fuscus TaxID=527200 RepID=A0ABW4YA97_9GAMM